MKKITPPRNHRPKNQDAVSPVVGVMLMLVVTIIIAAVVSSFASGLGTTSEAAPAVSLGISISSSNVGDSAKYVTIDHLGGETLNTKDLQIISTYTVPGNVMKQVVSNAEKVIKHTIDGSMDPIPENDLNNDTGLGYPWIPQKTNNDDIVSKRTADGTFGTAVLISGSSLRFDRSYFLGFDTEDEDVLKDYGFATGTKTHVTIVHLPSGKTIYDRDVVIA
ncbi:type IV pilin N-terminal domain-containing protein [Methanocorpusculum vombati]|uniref:Type IV pilin N-terminal domain-containing protein n=1 Tax=Methanocorpusculum vombati TaxID=3002864 RepID=A0ABT4IKT1_9EURY|nr:type IV pilin N-terminal domain-containing protein [Methanocorpusculum vombati]MCZ9319167.1 type IV pilin N-terminal domain-containing protein [Methanocorpusculum sp.]MCZ0861750.1 type IV pilin N-terminal domain-containing protein [Methanocorpusculum vombati]MDE2521280.1 type IV pilin N-terminal domain-containing protein [Methanocorpusculum sp.]MDE2535017.1 type IV pilin N-terminal domain-containing protein [Methanocorpusculum sp.]MDE2545565.1 type IV pilin N-terminal domain-containing prot